MRELNANLLKLYLVCCSLKGVMEFVEFGLVNDEEAKSYHLVYERFIVDNAALAGLEVPSTNDMPITEKIEALVGFTDSVRAYIQREASLPKEQRFFVLVGREAGVLDARLWNEDEMKEFMGNEEDRLKISELPVGAHHNTYEPNDASKICLMVSRLI